MSSPDMKHQNQLSLIQTRKQPTQCTGMHVMQRVDGSNSQQ